MTQLMLAYAAEGTEPELPNSMMSKDLAVAAALNLGVTVGGNRVLRRLRDPLADEVLRRKSQELGDPDYGAETAIKEGRTA